MKIILVSAVALIDVEGRILLAQRPEGKSMAGLWEFPGGKIDAGETPEYALMRELREHVGGCRGLDGREALGRDETAEDVQIWPTGFWVGYQSALGHYSPVKA